MGLIDRLEQQLFLELSCDTSLDDTELAALEDKIVTSTVRAGKWSVERTPQFDVPTGRLYAVRNRSRKVNDFVVWSDTKGPKERPLDAGRRRVNVEWSDVTKDRHTPDSEGIVSLEAYRMARGVRGFPAYEAFLHAYGNAIRTADASARVEISVFK